MMGMPTPPRRWFAFRLRTLFVLAAVLSIPLACVGYSLNWISERHAMLTRHGVSVPWCWSGGPPGPPKAPMILRVFGEYGIQVIFLDCKAPSSPRRPEVAKLFPEAEIIDVEQQP